MGISHKKSDWYISKAKRKKESEKEVFIVTTGKEGPRSIVGKLGTCTGLPLEGTADWIIMFFFKDCSKGLYLAAS